MKMITAIINKEDSNAVSSSLTKAGFSVTRLSTTGGFLMAGNVTLLIGVEDEKVDEVIGIISEHSCQRKEIVPSTASYGVGGHHRLPAGGHCRGATIFVTNIERFEKV